METTCHFQLPVNLIHFGLTLSTNSHQLAWELTGVLLASNTEVTMFENHVNFQHLPLGRLSSLIYQGPKLCKYLQSWGLLYVLPPLTTDPQGEYGENIWKQFVSVMTWHQLKTNDMTASTKRYSRHSGCRGQEQHGCRSWGFLVESLS